MKVLLIDIGKTILTNESFNFNKGIESIYNYTFKESSLEDLLYYNEKLNNITFIKRDKVEVNLKLYLSVLLKLANLTTNKSLEELEEAFLESAACDNLIPGVYDFLDNIFKLGILIICVSNSCISSECLTKQLESFGVNKFIYKVISSSNIGYRKPSPLIFNYSINEARLKFTEEISTNDIYFLGNDYELDIKASQEIGLKPIWFNAYNEEDYLNICFINENNYKNILEKIKELCVV